MKFFILWVSLLLFFGGCSLKQYETSEPKLIVLKTKKLKFSDTGYIRSAGDAVEVELFSAGQAAGRIVINHLVCVDDKGCLSKSAFNAEYLNGNYPDETMQYVLLGKPIFSRRSLQRNTEGFEQRIENSEVDIVYRVDARQIYFKDRKNKILIKIKTIAAQKRKGKQ
jgi:hypothetical protein